MSQTNVISTKYIKETEASIQIRHYKNNRTALQLVGPSGELLLTATVNLPHEELPDNQVFIKNYAENTGILTVLQEKKIIKLVDRQVMSGFVWLDVAELRPTTDWLLPYEDHR